MRKEHSKVIFSINFSHYFNSYTIFGIISNTLSALYNKRPLEAVIVLFIFVGKFTILFFSCFFFKIGKQDRLSFDDRLSFEHHLSLDNLLSFERKKKLLSSFPGVLAYHSTTAYRSNVQKKLLSSFPRVLAYHSMTTCLSNIPKNTVVIVR